MKKIFRYLFLTLLVMGVASCSDDILVNNEGGEQNVGQKLSVTGTIVEDAATRVSLADGGTSLAPSWEVGDQVFGFYGENKLTYRVASVTDGVATFSLVEGSEPGNGTTVHMIYAPAKSASDLNGGQLTVDLSQQDGTLAGVKNHAIMCATATVSEGKLTFSFLNQVAILGVKQFTGLKASTTYTSATFTSAGPTATVKVEGGVLKLVTDDAYGTITANGSFAADASGNTTSTIYFAVPPTAAVAHTFCLHSATDHRAGNLSPKAVTAGKYMYMNSKAMAQTIFFDDFETTAENAFPASLGIYHNGSGNENQKVITSEKKNGNKALQLQGRSSWSANITQSGLFDYDDTETYIMECYMYQVNETGTANGGMGFAQLYSNGGYHKASVYWNHDSWNYASGSGFTPYSATNETGKWYHLKIVCDFNTNLYDVYVDGVMIASGVTMNNITPTCMLLAAGNGGTNNVYFDDVIVYAKPRTPDNISNYTEIAYIQSSGTQYINTRIAPTADTKVVLKDFCCLSANHWDMFLGMSNEIGEAHTWMLRYGDDSTIQSCIGDIQTSPYRNYAQAYSLGTTLSEVSMDYANGLMINGVKATYSGYQNTPTYSTQPIYLFGGNNLSGAFWRGPSMRISACEIWEGSTKVRDFVAVKRKSDNVLGLFDRVENRFYINKGSGAFIPPLDPSTISGSAPVTVTDNVNANARTSCGWVQLWAGGPKWAEFNVGSGITSYANVTSYDFNVIGGYYSFKGAKHNVENVGGVTDTATSLWGSNWRTPSYDEENAMLNNCDFTYCDGTTVQYESGCTLKGYKVSGRGDYASNHIFLPLGGVDDQNRGPSYVVAVGERGLFWSTLSGGSGAYYLHVKSDGTKEMNSHNQPHGNTVRAVLAES